MISLLGIVARRIAHPKLYAIIDNWQVQQFNPQPSDLKAENQPV